MLNLNQNIEVTRKVDIIPEKHLFGVNGNFHFMEILTKANIFKALN